MRRGVAVVVTGAGSASRSPVRFPFRGLKNSPLFMKALSDHWCYDDIWWDSIWIALYKSWEILSIRVCVLICGEPIRRRCDDILAKYPHVDVQHIIYDVVVKNHSRRFQKDDS